MANYFLNVELNCFNSFVVRGFKEKLFSVLERYTSHIIDLPEKLTLNALNAWSERLDSGRLGLWMPGCLDPGSPSHF